MVPAVQRSEECMAGSDDAQPDLIGVKNDKFRAGTLAAGGLLAAYDVNASHGGGA